MVEIVEVPASIYQEDAQRALHRGYQQDGFPYALPMVVQTAVGLTGEPDPEGGIAHPPSRN